jgi:hypothetical protein
MEKRTERYWSERLQRYIEVDRPIVQATSPYDMSSGIRVSSYNRGGSINLDYSEEALKAQKELRKLTHYSEQEEFKSVFLDTQMYRDEPIYINVVQSDYDKFISSEKRYNYDVSADDNGKVTVTVFMGMNYMNRELSAQFFDSVNKCRKDVIASVRPTYTFYSSSPRLLISTCIEYYEQELDWFNTMMTENGFKLDLTLMTEEMRKRADKEEDKQELIKRSLGAYWVSKIGVAWVVVILSLIAITAGCGVAVLLYYFLKQTVLVAIAALATIGVFLGINEN